uniref:PHD-type domain-containing protein n=1 Tax=Daucus carota subsp. sativus TaxID=79200 RepID=A0A162AE44_DAUCS
MRLSRPAVFSRTRRKRSKGAGSGGRVKKKHKRLDAISEEVYSRNHGVVKLEVAEGNEGYVGGGSGSRGNEAEVRRSSRARRVPDLLDASPLPPKKRQRLEKETGIGKGDEKLKSPCSTSKKLEEESGEWKMRLRDRSRNGSFREKGVRDSSAKGKRKLFEDGDGLRYQSKVEGVGLSENNQKVRTRKLETITRKSHKTDDIRVLNVSNNKHQETSSGSVLEGHKDKNKAELSEDKGGDTLILDSGDTLHMDSGDTLNMNSGDTLIMDSGDTLPMDNELRGEHEGKLKHNPASTEILEEKEDEIPPSVHSEHCMVNGNLQPMEQDKVDEQPVSLFELEDQTDTLAAGGTLGQQADGKSNDKPLESESSKYVDNLKYPLKNELSKPRIKKGRRCGLCGGGTDGKPPKILLQHGLGSDDEAYSGSSDAEEPQYDTLDGFGNEPSWLGRLLGPINDRFGIAGIWVHQHCAVWSPEVYFAGLGRLKNVRAALCRGRLLKCSRCGRRGATVGCRVDRCTKTYHLPCARANGCIFNHRKFLIACTDHRNIFQPQGSKKSSWLKKMKAKKMKMEIRKQSGDAWRKDVEAEEKWLENCGEDEEFLKRESKRLQRDLLRIAPIYIGGSKTDNETQYGGWESVAGLQNVIHCLKEVVILPLLYPEFFSNIGLTPPRGVLLHGYPGTGKTLVVRSLIGACARGDKRIAYFARKGADCLGKYVGDAERQLRLLFQVAEKSQPSIIFFDEIDGLAPSRTRQQDQTHSSVVSTLLALMDGLKSRGSVVVIGATNRPDAVDPALRRPGRFDREIYFPLPSVKDRESILSLHTKKWPKAVTGSLLKWIARRTAGFAGADLQALCTQAAMIALKRSCPLHKILSEAEGNFSHGKRPALPSFNVEERDWLEALSCAPPPCSRREAGMAANDVVSSPLPAHLIPCLIKPLSTLLLSMHLDERTWLPPPLSRASTLIKDVILSVLKKKNIKGGSWWSHAHGLLEEADVLTEIASSLSRERLIVGDACALVLDTLNEGAGDQDVLGVQPLVTRTTLLQNVSLLGKKSGFRILISGDPCGGQKHIASCILHCFVGNVEIRKIDLATIAQEGNGDLMHGVTQILSKCTCLGSCIVSMPRIDLWAVETSYEECHSPATEVDFSEQSSFVEHSDDLNQCSPAESAEPQVPILKASHLWCSFIEQVESICVSTSLIIMIENPSARVFGYCKASEATSDMPFPLLPQGIKQFFESDTFNCSLSAPLKDAVPRFSVLVGGNFDRDMVIDFSAANLSKDLAKYFLQLIHSKAHTTEGSEKEGKALDARKSDANAGCPNHEPVSASNPECPNQFPANPVMRDAPPSVTKNMKGKSNLMLALITFGYQILLGMYISPREVSAEVRKVLELLVVWIHAKIDAGSDKCNFGRLLSQVAYLEDLVNSWAYLLQSLEIHGQVTEADPMGPHDRYKICEDEPITENGLHDAESRSPLYLNITDTGSIPSHIDADAGQLNGKVKATLEEPSRYTSLQSQNSIDINVELLNGKDGVSSPTHELKSSENDVKVNKVLRPISNGYIDTDSVVVLEDGPRALGDHASKKYVDGVKDSNQDDNILSSDDIDVPPEDGNTISSKENGIIDPVPNLSFLCLYRCCSKCLVLLQRLVRKNLYRQPGLRGSQLTVEDVHDSVKSSSVHLHSEVRKFCSSENLKSLLVENVESCDHVELDEGQKTKVCRCKNSGKKFIRPCECTSHPRMESATAEASTWNPRELELELIYKDGVLVSVDPTKEVSWHCKFETLCLCSLIEWIDRQTKQPSD